MKTQTVTLVEILLTQTVGLYMVRMMINPRGLNHLFIESQMTEKEIWHTFDIHPSDLAEYRVKLEKEFNQYCNS